MVCKSVFRSVLTITLCGVLSLALSCPLLQAQTQAFTATLSGTVMDPSGGVLAGAKVTLTSAERGITRTYTTDALGTYAFSLLPPAVYSLQVEVPGFKTYRQDGMSMPAGHTTHQPVSFTLVSTSA